MLAELSFVEIEARRLTQPAIRSRGASPLRHLNYQEKQRKQNHNLWKSVAQWRRLFRKCQQLFVWKKSSLSLYGDNLPFESVVVKEDVAKIRRCFACRYPPSSVDVPG
jgi:hypothetical protein